MLYYSTNRNSQHVDFREATIRGQAPDGGLYFPEKIPILTEEFLNSINDHSREDIALEIIRPYVGDTIPESELKRIASETIDFQIPLVPVADGAFALELFHGPTLAFKDIGARFMSRCLRYFMKNEKRPVTVLVATSGDTGGAVANGFFDVDGINVVILYPSGKVSNIQELQLTTLGKNVRAIKVEGSFDDCQSLVKEAFRDEVLCKEILLTSANSINVARWLPQQFYYFFAWQQWPDKKNPPVISVPSGNFGNICAGLMAHYSGLPVAHFIAACNANDSVPDFLKTGHYRARQTVSTISNAMDVGNPSNFIRILELFEHRFHSLQKKLSAYSITDVETKDCIRETYNKYNYVLDPHGAVGYLALEKYLIAYPENKGIFLETAHPVKFYDVVEPVIEEPIAIPSSVLSIMHKKKESHTIKYDFQSLKDYLMER